MILFVMALVPSVVGAHLGVPGCSPYGPAVVTLKGTLIMAASAGPPDHADTGRGGAPAHVFVLKLDRAICVEPDSSSWLYNDPQRGVREVQLAVIGDSLLVRLRRLVGQQVVVSGQLLSAGRSGRQHAVLLVLRNVRAA